MHAIHSKISQLFENIEESEYMTLNKLIKLSSANGIRYQSNSKVVVRPDEELLEFKDDEIFFVYPKDTEYSTTRMSKSGKTVITLKNTVIPKYIVLILSNKYQDSMKDIASNTALGYRISSCGHIIVEDKSYFVTLLKSIRKKDTNSSKKKTKEEPPNPRVDFIIEQLGRFAAGCNVSKIYYADNLTATKVDYSKTRMLNAISFMRIEDIYYNKYKNPSDEHNGKYEFITHEELEKNDSYKHVQILKCSIKNDEDTKKEKKEVVERNLTLLSGILGHVMHINDMSAEYIKIDKKVAIPFNCQNINDLEYQMRAEYIFNLMGLKVKFNNGRFDIKQKPKCIVE